MNGDMNDAVFCDMELLNTEGTFYNDSWRRHSNAQPYGCQNAGFDMKPEFAKDDLEAVVSCSIDLMEDVSSSSSADSQISRRMTLVATNSASSGSNIYNIRNDWSFPVNPHHAFVSGEITQYLNQSLNRFVTVKDENEGRIGCHLPHSGLVKQYNMLPDEFKLFPLTLKKKCTKMLSVPKMMFLSQWTYWNSWRTWKMMKMISNNSWNRRKQNQKKKIPKCSKPAKYENCSIFWILSFWNLKKKNHCFK